MKKFTLLIVAAALLFSIASPAQSQSLEYIDNDSKFIVKDLLLGGTDNASDVTDSRNYIFNAFRYTKAGFYVGVDTISADADTSSADSILFGIDVLARFVDRDGSFVTTAISGGTDIGTEPTAVGDFYIPIPDSVLQYSPIMSVNFDPQTTTSDSFYISVKFIGEKQ